MINQSLAKKTSNQDSYSPLRRRDASHQSRGSQEQRQSSRSGGRQSSQNLGKPLKGILTNNYPQNSNSVHRDDSRSKYSQANNFNQNSSNNRLMVGANQFAASNDEEMMSAHSGFPNNTGLMSGIGQQFHQGSLPENTQSTLEMQYQPNLAYKRSHERFDTLGVVQGTRHQTIQHDLDAPLVNLTNQSNFEQNRYMNHVKNYEEAVNRNSYNQSAQSSTAQGAENFNPNIADPYAPNLVYDLLQGKKEWKNIQDIVKLTFIAICDTVKSQGVAIRDLERQLMKKANTDEIVTQLNQKANVNDVSRRIAEVQLQVDKKQGQEDIARLMEDRVTKQEIQYMISNKVSIEELTRVLQTKCNVHEVNMDLTQMN